MQRRLVARITDRRRRLGLPIGLVVVFLLIGHDGMMAGDVHASPSPRARHGIPPAGATHPTPPPAAAHDQHHQGSMQRAPAVMRGMGDGMTPPHPATCATVRSAVPRLGENTGSNGTSDIGDAVDPFRLDLASPAAAAAWQTPTQPSHTRRALLQVYRI